MAAISTADVSAHLAEASRRIVKVMEFLDDGLPPGTAQNVANAIDRECGDRGGYQDGATDTIVESCAAQLGQTLQRLRERLEAASGSCGVAAHVVDSSVYSATKKRGRVRRSLML
jgi:hypothetical protein